MATAETPATAAAALAKSLVGGRRVALAHSRTRLALGAMVIFNLLLVGLTWRSQDSTRDLIENLGVAQAPAEHPAAPQAVKQREHRDAPLIEDLRAEGYETLDEARRAIERGEFQVAREMLYGLLSVIDRVDDRARYDVEARAAFLIGDAFRLEADALARAANGVDDEGGQL